LSSSEVFEIFLDDDKPQLYADLTFERVEMEPLRLGIWLFLLLSFVHLPVWQVEVVGYLSLNDPELSLHLFPFGGVGYVYKL
jgi:hypothetical protein